MKKKYFSTLLMGLLVLGTTGTVTSCKDYDDDINGLQEQITANKNAIDKINALIASGSVITNVEKADDGVTVTLSNGNTFNIKNGKEGQPGTPGTVWTIGEDGYWVKDGVKTNYYALGTKGEKGDKGDQGDKGDKGDKGDAGSTATVRYYVPNPETGCFDIYEGDKKVESTDISFKNESASAITAVLDNKSQTLTFTGVDGVTGGVYTLSLAGTLRSLVFMPKLYLDGIETIIYPYLHDTTLVKYTLSKNVTNHQGKECKIGDGEVDYKLADTPAEFNYGPTWPVEYHINPANAQVDTADLNGYSVLEPEAIYYNTRATANALGVTAQFRNAAGNMIFKSQDGILTAGLQIKNPQLLNEFPTNNTYNDKKNKPNTVALEVNTKDAAGVVTSDYALLQPERAYVEAIYWAQKPMYGETDLTKRKRTGDVIGKHCQEMVHVYDTLTSALKDKDGAALELYYDEKETLDIKSFLGIHMLKQNAKIEGHPYELVALTPEKAAEWGLNFKFKLVSYSVDDNETDNSKFATFVNSKDGGISSEDGILRANNVDKDGSKLDATSRTAVGREPLVQVIVTNAYGDVVLDGYILVHITEKAMEEAPNKNIPFASANAKFDLCNGAGNLRSDWAQFNKIVLTDSMGNMRKDVFDAQYQPDYATVGKEDGLSRNDEYSGGVLRLLKQFNFTGDNDPKLVKGDAKAETAPLGNIWYNEDTEGTTNHVFYWEISAEELEALTHDENFSKLPITVSRWVRYKATNSLTNEYGYAKYPYVYIKLTYTITRDDIKTVAFGEKNLNLWVALNGEEDGTEAVRFDIGTPEDNGSIAAFVRNFNSTLVGDKLMNPGKYYVVPTNDITITAQDGKKYTIKGQSSDLVCKYCYCKKKHNYSELDEVLSKCAIDYNKGAFANNAIYANNEKIATLNQLTGEITLLNNEITKAVLNAVGYNETKNKNVPAEILRAKIGFVAENGCGVATKVTDGTFTASWERPINLSTSAKAFVDAKTNGNYLYLLDILNMYDWRGPVKGNMGGLNDETFYYNANNTWFWAFYGIKSIKVNLDPDSVETDMHYGEFRPLKDVTEYLTLRPSTADDEFNNNVRTFKFDLHSFNSQAKNNDLIKYMKDNKKSFGYIFYTNNGNNVEEFTIKVPITVEYTWGKFETKVSIKIHQTLGN